MNQINTSSWDPAPTPTTRFETGQTFRIGPNDYQIISVTPKTVQFRDKNGNKYRRKLEITVYKDRRVQYFYREKGWVNLKIRPTDCK